MRAAGGLGHDPVDHAELQEVGRGDAHRPRRRPRAPGSRRPRGWRRIPRARSPSRWRAPASAPGRPCRCASAPPLPPSPVTTATMGVGRPAISRRFRAIASAWPALLGAEAGIGAGRVDERDDGLAEPLGELHQPQRLAVSLGVRHPEVPVDLLPRVPALLVAHHHDRAPFEAGQAADDGGVVAEEPIAVELDEVVEEERDQVARVRPLRVAGELYALPGRQPGEDPLRWSRCSRSSSCDSPRASIPGSPRRRSVSIRFSSSRSGRSKSSAFSSISRPRSPASPVRPRR